MVSEENSVYEIGRPIIDEVEIELSSDYFSGKTLLIKANNKLENSESSVEWQASFIISYST